MYFPFSVLADVTGSVAIKTAPKQNPPRMRCSYHGIAVIPKELNNSPMMLPPTKTLSMVFQLAIPVHNNIMAPIPIAITLVSPIEPGINPSIISLIE